MFRLSLLATLVLVPVGLLDGAGTRVVFDPADPETGPFPTDRLTVTDTAQKTGIRMNLPVPDCSAEPSTCAEIGLINELDGFNLHPRIKVRFSDEIDVHSLRQGIFFVWLDDLTNEEFGLYPEGHVTPINQVLYHLPTMTAFAEPDEILGQHRRYALVVTDAVRDVAGDPVVADPAFLSCITGQDGYCGQLAQVTDIVAPAFAPQNIVAASLFTTLSATAWLERARDRLEDAPPQVQRPSSKSVFNLSEVAAIVVQQQMQADPSNLTPAAVPLFLLNGVGQIAFGSYWSPSFLSAQQVIPATPTQEDVALPAQSKEIFFSVLLPDAPAPPGGYPVVIAGHGAGMHSLGYSQYVASSLAAHGFATIAINAVGHGFGPESKVMVREKNGSVTQLPYGGRAVDMNGDGAYAPVEGCFLLAGPRPVGARDCFRQTAIDLLQLVRAIHAGIDLDADGLVELDANRVYYLGISLGSTYGTVFAAVAPDVPAAVMTAGGGSFADMRYWSVAARDYAKIMLGGRVPSLLNLGGDFNPDYVLRYRPPEIIDVPGALEIQEYFERFEWLSMPGDQLAYAPHLRSSTLPGVPIKKVLFQYGKGDLHIVNPVETALVRAANMRDTTSFYRHDLARALMPDLYPNAHVFTFPMFPPGFTNPLGQYLIAMLAQEQAAGFLASDGAVVPDVNVWSQIWFGQSLFETPPQFLTEDLNF